MSPTACLSHASSPARLNLSAPLHVTRSGARFWRLQNGWLEPVHHRLVLVDTLSPLWAFLASQEDCRHVHLTSGGWDLTDQGMDRLADFRAA